MKARPLTHVAYLAAWEPEWREEWQERAAILEYEGNLLRAAAEQRAFDIVDQRREASCKGKQTRLQLGMRRSSR